MVSCVFLLSFFPEIRVAICQEKHPEQLNTRKAFRKTCIKIKKGSGIDGYQIFAGGIKASG